MSHSQLFFIVPLSIFYISYLAKMARLRRKGIRGNILGKGNKPKKEIAVEIIIKTITLCGVIVQYGSVIWFNIYRHNEVNIVLWTIGIFLVVVAVAFFVDAILVMKDNWRAGYNDEQKTNLVTRGIYKMSRNPAFVGFDLMYIGCAVAYPNILIITWSILAIIMFHLQILGEERFLKKEFGAEYAAYVKKVPRYLLKI